MQSISSINVKNGKPVNFSVHFYASPEVRQTQTRKMTICITEKELGINSKRRGAGRCSLMCVACPTIRRIDRTPHRRRHPFPSPSTKLRTKKKQSWHLLSHGLPKENRHLPPRDVNVPFRLVRHK
ncbi:hypothetical protein TcCL_ESM05443 [Trypanosoma cruzi]|nr:hypothetical protein TcCL_ESM05443 [Trypanosoma cruzi]